MTLRFLSPSLAGQAEVSARLPRFALRALPLILVLLLALAYAASAQQAGDGGERMGGGMAGERAEPQELKNDASMGGALLELQDQPRANERRGQAPPLERQLFDPQESSPFNLQIGPPNPTALFGIGSPFGAEPISGKPLFAEFTTTHQQSFADGNNIASTTTSAIYRDGEGRIRREAQLAIPGLPMPHAPSSFVTIADSHSGYGYVLNTQERVARRYLLNGLSPYVAQLNAQGREGRRPGPPAGSQPPPPDASRWKLRSWLPHRRDDGPGPEGRPSGPPLNAAGMEGFTATPSVRMDQPFLAAPNPVRTESLGERKFAGYVARGSRVITTVPAGRVGNQRPIDIVSEQWFCPELGMVVASLHRDPWAGEFSTTVTHISRGAQPSRLFTVPSAYKVVDAADEPERHLLGGPHGDGQHAPPPPR